MSSSSRSDTLYIFAILMPLSGFFSIHHQSIRHSLNLSCNPSALAIFPLCYFPLRLRERRSFWRHGGTAPITAGCIRRRHLGICSNVGALQVTDGHRPSVQSKFARVGLAVGCDSARFPPTLDCTRPLSDSEQQPRSTTNLSCLALRQWLFKDVSWQRWPCWWHHCRRRVRFGSWSKPLC
jgi:hypothetical protein